MIYCLNPSCPNPKNPNKTRICQSCGSDLKLNNRYLVGKTLGQGGFGATFLAVDTSLPGNPVCVIKQLRPANNTESFLKMARELFQREAETLGKLGNHPQVPRLLDYFEIQEQFFLVQEFVKGSNLQKEVKNNGPFTEAGVRQFLTEILPLFEYIHSQKVIHRDIKPANIIRREIDRKLVLIDFGAVKNRVNEVMAADLSGDNPLTSFAVGTPGYSPPEQMAMRPTYASDIYSLGATCIYLLAGRSPKDIGYNSRTGALDWEQYVDVSDHLKRVLKKMLEMAVRDRYQSAQAVLDGLEMEAYEESLSQGLVKRSPASNSGNLEQKNSKDQSNWTSKVAESIRQRRTRMGLPTSRQGDNSQGLSGGERSRTAGSRKLTAKQLAHQYRQGRRDFSHIDLYRLELEEANLRQCIFREANLMQTNLRKGDLRGADFANGNLKRVVLREAKLSNAFFSHADLQKADLRKADLTLANFQNAKLAEADLSGANLTNAKITEKQLAEAKTNWATILPNGKRALW
ncbi:serine/threonine protein kinase [Halothece sp. PCC 7418]|uniref:serine/threonine-protein kinase n=1 Tax=Halothece sp. (strain PCC 7418) TaxID=65093 RepID=UPI0002A0693C|nr:serine/threonine-protein kinase [Halothece sp. PCC 7418]AFZ42663.1 serine/threonine protein kinase [Halothece sp. PCC 7418]